MAQIKFVVTRKCGHSQIYTTYFPEEREKITIKAAKKLCLDCSLLESAAKYSKRAAEIEEATAANEAAGYPFLSGSGRDIEKAELIRHNTLRRADEVAEKWRAIALAEAGTDRAMLGNSILAVISRLKSSDSASKWVRYKTDCQNFVEWLRYHCRPGTSRSSQEKLTAKHLDSLCLYMAFRKERGSS